MGHLDFQVTSWDLTERQTLTQQVRQAGEDKSVRSYPTPRCCRGPRPSLATGPTSKDLGKKEPFCSMEEGEGRGLCAHRAHCWGDRKPTCQRDAGETEK